MLMIPIAALSLVVVAVGFERLFALRKSRIFPGRLHRELRRAAQDSPDVSPNELFRAAELVPSSASVVLKSLLGKVGRPLPELESAIAQGVQNEAERLYHNVRWLSLAAAIAPLLGLLGTVWGMILCFYNTSQLSAGSNRAAVLAEGIYIALVTTLAGLVVAIPAAILSHYFEGKISRTLNSVESELLRLAGRLERFEGKTRFEVTSQGIFSHPIGGSVRHAGSSDGPPTPPPVRAPKVIKP
jgi:biopolymer transport protein ExbB